MRLLMPLLVALALPGTLPGQAPEPDAAPQEAVTLERESPPVTEIPAATVAGPPEQVLPAPSIVESNSAAAAAQPTMRNFLYQVLLAAVTALITALIWKAVF